MGKVPASPPKIKEPELPDNEYKERRLEQLAYLRKNWESSDPKWWIFTPKNKPPYQFTHEQYLLMSEMVTDQERDRLSSFIDDDAAPSVASDALKIPFYFVKWFLKKWKPDEFQKLAMQQGDDILTRTKNLSHAILRELEVRMSNKAKRDKIPNDELIRMSVGVTQNYQRLLEGQGDLDTLKMEIVSSMPKKKKEKK